MRRLYAGLASGTGAAVAGIVDCGVASGAEMRSAWIFGEYAA
jgi:hypothetical protein